VGARLAGATTLMPFERGRATRLRVKPTGNEDIANFFACKKILAFTGRLDGGYLCISKAKILICKDDAPTIRSKVEAALTRQAAVALISRRIPAETLRCLWTMLAHSQGTLLNASHLASGLNISAPTVSSYTRLAAGAAS